MPRFDPGSIHLNDTRDYPLLRQILRSAYATKNQLFEFMQLDGRERSPQDFHRRLQRLVKHTLVRRHDGLPGHSHALYSIGEIGMEKVVARGEPYAGRGSGLDRPVATAQHALELNDIHLTLLRRKLLADWIPESEICSRNILTSYGYAKDYDAIVTLHHADTKVTFALEYERSQKTDGEYDSIALALNRETIGDFILYLVRTRHLFAKLSDCLRRVDRPVALGMTYDFHHKLLDADVSLLKGSFPPMTIRELLNRSVGVDMAHSRNAGNRLRQMGA